MTARRLLPLIAILALLVAPFGRMGMAEAAAAPHHAAPAAMAGHCDDRPASAPDRPDKAAIDCMTACAAIMPAAAPRLAGTPPPAIDPGIVPPAAFHGLHPAADPPPPRAS